MKDILAAIVPGMFGVIGLLFIGFLWFGNDGFGSPPVFFKLFGSCIGIVFVVVGFKAAATVYSKGLPGLANPHAEEGRTLGAASRNAGERMRSEVVPSNAAPSEAQEGYRCPRCGAALGGESDVSPKGDVKCGFCDRWFNIHES